MADFNFYCPWCTGKICTDSKDQGIFTSCPHCKKQIQVPIDISSVPKSSSNKTLPQAAPEPQKKTLYLSKTYNYTMTKEKKKMVILLIIWVFICAIWAISGYIYFNKPKPESKATTKTVNSPQQIESERRRAEAEERNREIRKLSDQYGVPMSEIKENLKRIEGK